jgi:flagellar biosynthesis/type III secretory pathway protein FliH
VDILHLIDRLEEIATEARRLPVGGGVVVQRQRILDLVDRMRVAVPREVYDARDLLESRDEFIRDGERKAAELLENAHEELERRLVQTEIVKAAHERAREIVAEGEQRRRELVTEAEEQARARLDEAQQTSLNEMQEADVYALQTLRRLEEELEGFLNTVRNGVDALEQRAADRPRG